MRDWTTIFLAGITLALAGLAWWRGEPALALAGLVQGGETLLSPLRRCWPRFARTISGTVGRQSEPG